MGKRASTSRQNAREWSARIRWHNSCTSTYSNADGLQDHLLIAHGMIDNNVFYKDSVMLAQKLIELRKDKWELASYPMERHGFVHPDSWYDEYRRIYELFERTLK